MLMLYAGGTTLGLQGNKITLFMLLQSEERLSVRPFRLGQIWKQ
jgi:hypothetical protein